MIVDDLLATGGTMEATVQAGSAAGRRYCRAGLCGGAGLSERPGTIPKVLDVFSLLHYNE